MRGDPLVCKIIDTLIENTRINSSLVKRDTQRCVPEARGHTVNNAQNEAAPSSRLRTDRVSFGFRNRQRAIQPDDSDARYSEYPRCFALCGSQGSEFHVRPVVHLYRDVHASLGASHEPASKHHQTSAGRREKFLEPRKSCHHEQPRREPGVKTGTERYLILGCYT